MVHPLGNLNWLFTCKKLRDLIRCQGNGVIRLYSTMVPTLSAEVVGPFQRFSFFSMSVLKAQLQFFTRYVSVNRNEKGKMKTSPAAHYSFYIINLVKRIRLVNLISSPRKGSIFQIRAKQFRDDHHKPEGLLLRGTVSVTLTSDVLHLTDAMFEAKRKSRGFKRRAFFPSLI